MENVGPISSPHRLSRTGASREYNIARASARVRNVEATIKPLPVDQILASVRKTGCAVTVEEHLLRGGMGGAVAETLVAAEPVPMEFVCVKDPDRAGDIFGGTDCFGQTGDADELLAHFGLTEDAVCQAAEKVMARKK